MWEFGPAFLGDVLIVGGFRYMHVYMAPLFIMYWVTIHYHYGLFINVCVISPTCHVSAVAFFPHYICVNMYSNRIH